MPHSEQSWTSEDALDDLRKPDSDERSYKLVTLKNNLCVILISDPETNSSAAAMAVCSGQLQDPSEVQGLAHFLEHMLFLGNEKFPEPSGFHSFCGRSAGYCNAWTAMDRTVYHFMLSHENLREALDRFSGFFSCPLFIEELTDRELHAIDSENNKNLQEDTRREFQLLRSTAKENHPLQRFGTGNYKTLHDMPIQAGTNIREYLLKFYEENYRANIMKLAILGRESLETLEQWTREFFSDIPDRNVEPLRGVSEDVADAFDSNWKQFYRIIPVKERRMLVLYFPVPSSYAMYLTKPLRLLSHCIGHEGPGSILSYLKREGWGIELGAGTTTQTQHFSLFDISIKLTAEGLRHYKDVLPVVFGYIHTVFRRASREDLLRVHREVSTMAELDFRFRSKVKEDRYTEHLASNLTRYPPAHALCGGELFLRPPDLDALDRLLDRHFAPDNLRVHLVAPLAEQPDLPAGADWREEAWYGTRYCREPVRPADLALPAAGGLAGLHLPRPNPFIPAASVLKAPRARAGGAPELVVDTPVVQCWHLLDGGFGQPKGAVQVQLTNAVGERSARDAACLRMVLEVMQEASNEEAYEAGKAGLHWRVANFADASPCAGLRLSFCGYDDRMPALVAGVLGQLAGLDFSAHRAAFALAKEATATDYRNRRFKQSYLHTLVATARLLEHPFHSNEERCAALEALSPADVQAFHAEFFAHLRVEIMVAGNFTRDEAVALAAAAAAALPCGPLPEACRPVLRIARLPAGRAVLHEQAGPDPAAVDSAVSVYLQCGPRGVETDVRLDLLCQLLDRALFQQLRTAERLGYVVSASAPRRWGVCGLRCVVQSTLPPALLESRVDACLRAFGARLAAMPEEEVAAAAGSLRTARLERDRAVDALCSRLMAEVCSHDFAFDRRKREAAALARLRRADLVDFFRQHIDPDSPTRSRALFLPARCTLSAHKRPAQREHAASRRRASRLGVGGWGDGSRWAEPALLGSGVVGGAGDGIRARLSCHVVGKAAMESARAEVLSASLSPRSHVPQRSHSCSLPLSVLADVYPPCSSSLPLARDLILVSILC